MAKPRGTWTIYCAVAALAACLATPALAQGTIQQSGPVTALHVPVWLGNGTQADSGTAAGSGPNGPSAAGASEQLLIVRGNGNPPFANAGSGPNGENWCDYDGPITSSAGYHYFCISPNAQGGGLLDYGYAGGASPLPLYFMLNGTKYQFPFVIGGIVGPATTVVGDISCWNNMIGTLLSDCGPPPNALREISTGSSDIATTADNTISWNSSTALAKTETLYACGASQKGFPVSVKDEYGNAGTYPITVTPSGSNTIDKALLYIEAFNFQNVLFRCNGAGNWIVQ